MRLGHGIKIVVPSLSAVSLSVVSVTLSEPQYKQIVLWTISKVIHILNGAPF